MNNIQGDLRKVLEYFYPDELADYCDQEEIPIPRARNSKQIQEVENKAAQDENHILGAIVRLGRCYLDWEDNSQGGEQ